MVLRFGSTEAVVKGDVGALAKVARRLTVQCTGCWAAGVIS